MTIKTKIVLSWAIVFGIVMTGFALIVYRTTQNALIERLDATLERFAARLEAELNEPDATSADSSVAELSRSSPQGFTEVRFRILRSDSSVAVEDSTLRAMPVPDLHDVEVNGPRTLTASKSDEEYRCLWTSLEVDDKIVYIAEIGMATRDVHGALARLRLMMLVALPLALAFSAL